MNDRNLGLAVIVLYDDLSDVHFGPAALGTGLCLNPMLPVLVVTGVPVECPCPVVGAPRRIGRLVPIALIDPHQDVRDAVPGVRVIGRSVDEHYPAENVPVLGMHYLDGRGIATSVLDYDLHPVDIGPVLTVPALGVDVVDAILPLGGVPLPFPVLEAFLHSHPGSLVPVAGLVDLHEDLEQLVVIKTLDPDVHPTADDFLPIGLDYLARRRVVDVVHVDVYVHVLRVVLTVEGSGDDRMPSVLELRRVPLVLPCVPITVGRDIRGVEPLLCPVERNLHELDLVALIRVPRVAPYGHSPADLGPVRRVLDVHPRRRVPRLLVDDVDVNINNLRVLLAVKGPDHEVVPAVLDLGRVPDVLPVPPVAVLRRVRAVEPMLRVVESDLYQLDLVALVRIGRVTPDFDYPPDLAVVRRMLHPDLGSCVVLVQHYDAEVVQLRVELPVESSRDHEVLSVENEGGVPLVRPVMPVSRDVVGGLPVIYAVYGDLHCHDLDVVLGQTLDGHDPVHSLTGVGVVNHHHWRLVRQTSGECTHPYDKRKNQYNSGPEKLPITSSKPF